MLALASLELWDHRKPDASGAFPKMLTVGQRRMCDAAALSSRCGCLLAYVNVSVLAAQGEEPQESVENLHHRLAGCCSANALRDGCADVLSCSLETHQLSPPSFSKTDCLNGGG